VGSLVSEHQWRKHSSGGKGNLDWHKATSAYPKERGPWANCCVHEGQMMQSLFRKHSRGGSKEALVYANGEKVTGCKGHWSCQASLAGKCIWLLAQWVYALQ